jgi:adenylate cyclase
MTTTRRLAAILAADVAGYSRLMGADEVGTLEALKSHRRSVVDPAITAHHGRIVKTTGDGLLVEFASAVDAVTCAMSVQEQMAQQNANGSEPHIQFRIGINIGDIISEGDDIFGDGVNVAARVENECEPGGVYLSGSVHEQVTGKTRFTFEDLDERTLKNIAKPVRLYEARFASAAIKEEERSNTSINPTSSSSRTPRISIVVMPFDNLSGDPSQDYVGDGIVENLTTDLSVNIDNLLVIARGSAFTYKTQKFDPKRIGRELNVHYLVHGSVMRTGLQVRINARLVDTGTGEQLWAERFDGEMSNVFGLQDQITARISNSLRYSLPAMEARHYAKTNSPDAFDLVLRARASHYEERRRAIYPLKQTESYYRQALAIDPTNVDAKIGLALVLAENLYSGVRTPAASPPTAEQRKLIASEANVLLQEAGLTKARSVDVHLARSFLYSGERKFHDAERELERARSINPNDVSVLLRLANIYHLTGNPEKSLPLFDEIVLRTALKSPAAHIILQDWGFALLLLGRWDDAVGKFQQSLAITGTDPIALVGLAVALAQSGKMDAAKASYDNFLARLNSQFPQLQPTIKIFWESQRRLSENAEFLNLVAATIVPGLRKLGLCEG